MEKDFGKIKKNDATEIIIRIDDFGGKKGLTIREFTTSDKYTGFTKSGTRIPAESFKSFKEIINAIPEDEFNVPVTESVESAESEKPKKKKKKEMDVPEEDLL